MTSPHSQASTCSASSSIGEWTQPRPRSATPRRRRHRESRQGSGHNAKIRRPRMEGATSQSESDASSDADGVFAFRPPTTVEQLSERHLTRPSQYVTSAEYRPSPHSDDAHTLVEPPAAILAGPSFFNVDTHGPPYSYATHSLAISSFSNGDIYSFSRPGPRAGHRKTNSEIRRTFQQAVTTRERVAPIPDNGSEVTLDRDESTLAFEFDDTETIDDPKFDWPDVPDDSPYPEVRASVSNIDDPLMPVLTCRMWIIGLSLCSISTALNTFFNFRFPAPTIAPLVLLLLSYPLGKFAAYVLPITKYRLPYWLGSFELSFNPGPWNIKEHVCVFLMANVSVNPAYAMNTIVVAEMFYKVRLGFGFDLTLILATRLTGFGVAGLVRRFLVWPGSMIWPQNLVACTLLNTLHAEEDVRIPGQISITRYKFFMLASGTAFAYYFLPGFLFQALSMFSYICWIAPNNVVVNQLFGVRSGLGLGILTFDWSQISFIGSPLMVPWWAQVHVIFGFILFYWIIAPILYYSNVWNLSHFPMASTMPYDNTGQPYNIHSIMTGDQPTFNATAYANYSPLYLPATYVIGYLLAIALSTCVLTHTILHHGRSVLDNIMHVSVEEDDVHAKMMRQYPEVPNWWYAICLTFFFSVAVLSVKIWPTAVPIWSLGLSVLLPVIYILPSGFIYAFTGQTVSLNLIGEMIPGVLFPGNPLANMIFKAYSVQSLSGALSFVQDLKLGHYIKTPPRASFLVQLVATIVACFIQVGVKAWLFANVHDLCSPNQKDLLTCPHNEVFFTASAVWGLIGPARQFGRHAMYGPELYALILGAIIPLPFWLYRRRFPDSKLPCINMPVFLNGPSHIPPATGINYSSWFAVGFIFQYLIRTRNFAWWSKFNYVLSAALDSGTVLSICAVFFFLQFPAGGVSVNWIGNTIFTRTADWEVKPLIPPSSTPF